MRLDKKLNFINASWRALKTHNLVPAASAQDYNGSSMIPMKYRT